jgi:hypothetical protein
LQINNKMNLNFYSKKNHVKSIFSFLVFSILLLINNKTFAQNVGINATGATPNSSAELDLNTGNTFTSPNGKGVLMPQVALTGATDATTIGTGNVNSILVYNTATAGAGSTAVVPGYYYWNSTTSRWCQLIPSTGGSNFMFSGFQVFTASGTFTIPSGVTRVMVEVWGGGGGGGGKSGANYAGTGGGAGGYAKSLFTVSSNITVTIGPGGAGGTGGGTGGNGTAGTASSVSVGAVLMAGGGAAGKGNDPTIAYTAAGGVPTATSASSLGITGYAGAASVGGAVGGAGGNAPSGGAGGQICGSSATGNAGFVPGGGGSGGACDGSAVGWAGGAGAAGMVIIWW